MTDGERPEWGSSGGNLSVLQTRGTTACLIISALRCWNSGRVGWAEPPRLALLQTRDHLQPLSIWRRKLNGLEGPAASYQAKTAAFSSFLSLSQGAAGEGLASALPSNKMANHLLSVAETTSTVGGAGQGEEGKMGLEMGISRRGVRGSTAD